MAEDKSNNNNLERNDIIPVPQGDRARTLFEYTLPSISGVAHSIKRPPINTNNFELKPAIIQMVHVAIQFHGLPNEDPNAHISDFLEICDTFKCNGVSDDAIRLRLFPFSLKDKAKAWLQSQPSYSISTWEDLAKRFLARYFPPAKTVRMRSEITNFVQIKDESLYDAWERYKELIRRCPHHGLPTWLIVQTFYNGLSPSNRSMVDATSGGIFMKKTPKEAYDLLEEMVSNTYHWQQERQLGKKAIGIYNVDTFTTIVAKLETLSNKLDKLTTTSIQSQEVVFDLCGGNHIIVDSQKGNPFTQGSESVNYINNTYWSKGNDQGWRNQSKQVPPRFQPQERPSVEELVSKLVAQNEMRFQNNEAVIKKLEIEVGQIANILSTKLPGALLNNIETNPREEVKAIIVRGKESPPLLKNKKKDEKKEKAETEKMEEVVEPSSEVTKEMKSYQPCIPFPGRLKQQQLDKQFSMFLEIFKKLHTTRIKVFSDIYKKYKRLQKSRPKELQG